MSTQKEQTRLRLLEAAHRLLLKRGFHEVGLDDIAEAAGVSRQAVYKSHFASKAELVLELVRHVHVAERLDELIAPIMGAPSGLAMLDAGIVAAVEIENRVHDLSLIMSTAAASDAGAARAWRNQMEGKRSGLRATFTRLAAEGQLAPTWTIEEAVELLFVLTSTDSYHHLVVEGGWKPAAMIQRTREICEKILVNPAKRPRRA